VIRSFRFEPFSEIEKRREKDRGYYYRNREYRKAARERWGKRNRDKLSVNNKKWYAEMKKDPVRWAKHKKRQAVNSRKYAERKKLATQ